MREDIERGTLDELSKKLRLVSRLVEQITEEGTKIQEMLRNSCVALKTELELVDEKRRAMEDALKLCYTRTN